MAADRQQEGVGARAQASETPPPCVPDIDGAHDPWCNCDWRYEGHGHRETCPVVAADSGRCTGDDRCTASPHIHGCYADRGACDSPAEHADIGSQGGSDV